MISKDELEKFTVLQLKEKLKSRKLATSGAKPELITRLYDNMLAEESLLGMTGGDNDSAGTSEFDLSNVDVDEVLGMDSELISPTEKKLKTTTITETAKLTTPAATVISETTAAVTTDDDKPKKAPKPQILAPEGVTIARKPVKRPAESLVTKTADGDATVAADGNGEANNGDETADKKASKLTAEEGQKLLLISKKLGLPCKGANGDDAASEDSLAKRTRRFGHVDGESGKKQSRLERFGLSVPPVADEKKQKRSERFGPVAIESATDDMKKSGADRFGNGKAAIASPELDEKMRKRAERFGAAPN